MKLDSEITLHFKDGNGNVKTLECTLQYIVDHNINDILEQLEPDCQSSSCNTESQNFCDCDPVYGDYELDEIAFNHET